MGCVESNRYRYRLLELCLQQWEIILLGGLSGRLDQTVHILSYLHKLRKTRSSVFAVTDDNIGWVLDEVRFAVFLM